MPTAARVASRPTGPVAFAIAALALALLPAPSARAQAADDLMSAPARKLFEDAKLARTESRFEDCYAHAVAAFRLARRPGVAALLGDCALDVGKPREAAEHIQLFLDDPPPQASEKLIAYQKERLAKAKAHIATVTIRTNVEGATVRIDAAPPKGATLYLDPGPHRFEATAEGYKPAELTLDLPAGSERTVSLDLEPLAPPPPHPEPETPPTPIGGAEPVVLGLGYGLGAAGLVAGAVLAGLSSSRAASRNDLHAALEQEGGLGACLDPSFAERCSELAADRTDATRFGNGSIGAFAAGGALFVATAIYHAIAESTASDPDPDVTFAPSLHPQHPGLTIVGRF